MGESFCFPTQGILGWFPYFCSFVSWALGPGPTLDWASALSRLHTGHEQVFGLHPSFKEAALDVQLQQLVALECQGWAPSQVSP